jgi:hypothetical protein
MAAKNIIRTYKLEDRIRVLKVQGLTDLQVSDRLNKEDLVGKDTISQPTISRWIKKDRKMRGQAAKTIVDDYLIESVPADLKLLDELTQFHLTLFRGKTTILEKDGEKLKAAEVTLNDRRVASRDILSIIQTKMKFIGVDGDPGTGDTGSTPIDLSKYRLDPDTKTACEEAE